MTTTDITEWREITAASLGLPKDKLLRVLAVVESAPNTNHAQELRNFIRPRLIELRPPRKITAQRLLFLPVEDMLTPPDQYLPEKGRLSRAILKPCWQLVLERDDGAVEAVTTTLQQLNGGAAQKYAEIGAPLWASASQGLEKYLQTNSTIGRHKIGGSDVVLTKDILTQISQLTEILTIAPIIEQTKIRLSQNPIRALSEFDVNMLRKIITELAADSIRKLEAFLRTIMARMSCPGELLKLFSSMSLRLDERERHQIIQKLGRGALVAVADEAVRFRTLDVSHIADPSKETRAAEQLASRLASLEGQVDSMTRNTLKTAVAAARNDIGNFVLDKLVVALDDAMTGSLKTLTANNGGAALDDAAEFQQEKLLDECAASLKRCAGFADAVGIRRDLEAKLRTICGKLERQGNAIGADAAHRQQRLILLVRLIEQVAGPDEAQRVLLAHFDRFDKVVEV